MYVFLKCCCVAVCYTIGECILWWCGNDSYVRCVKCAVLWQGIISMVRVLCGCVAACY